MTTILIEPGHGGADPGACNGARHEADDVLRLGLAVGAILKGQGLAVNYTRTTDATVNLDTVARQAGISDLTLSIHRNSAAAASATGIEVLYRYDGSRTAAEAVLSALYAVAPVAQRGVKQFNYRGFSGVLTPAVLAEVLFINNPVDNAQFDKYFEQYARAIARGAMKALGLEFKEENKMKEVQPYQIAAMKALVDEGYVTTPSAWQDRLGEEISIGETMALLAATLKIGPWKKGV
jgi:N-acetylmuramoyl-L-alanine amidase